MPIPSKTYGKGRSGVANVSISGEKVTVTFEDNDQVISCLLADAPSYIRPGRQAITLNSNNTEIYGARPIGGTYRAIFAGFAARENEPPTIREVAAKSGVSKAGKPYKITSHLEFTALFDVVSGKWKGYRLVYNLPYGFTRYDQKDDDTPITQVSGTKLIDFLQILGMDFDADTLPWSENVLPYLEKLLAARKRQLVISLNENGWVKDISEPPDEDDEEAAPTKSETELVDELTGRPPEAKAPEAKAPKDKKAEVQAPTMLTLLFNNAKAGDMDALGMLTNLAASGNKAAKELIEQLQ